MSNDVLARVIHETLSAVIRHVTLAISHLALLFMPKDSFRIGIIILVIVGVIAVIGLPTFAIVKFYQIREEFQQRGADIGTFEECIAAGYPVTETYPRVCTVEADAFTREYREFIGNQLEKQDLIRAEKPWPNDIVFGPMEIRGQARGAWYFEASFPVRLLDGNGKELAVKPAQADGDWMTEEFVPFTETLTFETPTTPTGTLILQKDNPSGLPEKADELRVPVRFGEVNGNEKLEMRNGSDDQAVGGCKITGCSGQVCADKEMITTCEFRAEYACYKNVVCTRQKNGACGWTENEELRACLKEKGTEAGEVRRVY